MLAMEFADNHHSYLNEVIPENEVSRLEECRCDSATSLQELREQTDKSFRTNWINLPERLQRR